MKTCTTHHMCDCIAAELERLRAALEFSSCAMVHAVELDYIGDGSTSGLFKEAIGQARAALKT